MATSTTTELDIDTSPILNELVRWVKTLSSAGVSPDKAVEVARDFMLASMMSGGDEEYDLDDEEYDEDDEEE